MSTKLAGYEYDAWKSTELEPDPVAEYLAPSRPRFVRRLAPLRVRARTAAADAMMFLGWARMWSWKGDHVRAWRCLEQAAKKWLSARLTWAVWRASLRADRREEEERQAAE